MARTSDLIFDVGMHMGEDTEFYLKKGFRVVAVEADPGHCSRVRCKFHQEVARGQLTIVNAAIAPFNGKASFFANKLKSDWGTMHRRWAERNAQLGAPSRAVEVSALRFSEVVKAHGVPYYLKVDIEGSDLLCVWDLALFADRPRFISIETSKTSFDELFHQLSSLWALGYRSYKIIPQYSVPNQRCPAPAREGRFVPHRFGLGSSGLFGDELPGDWVDIEAAVARYRRIFKRYRLFGDGSRLRGLVSDKVAGWHDLHAMHVTETGSD